MSLTLSTILAVSDHVAGGGAGGEHAAAEEHHKSEAPFFIAGAIFVAFAIILSVIGFKKPDFPDTAGLARGIMAVGTTLAVAAVASAIYVAI
jgi:hypothetical protein